MAKYREIRPSNFSEFVSSIEELLKSSSNSLWYRGVGKSSHELLPSLYRHKTTKLIADLAIMEDELIVRFRQRSLPFHDRILTDNWDTLFLMQHYGVPTRLLDWTESPFVGLYFVIMYGSYEYQLNRNIKYNDEAALWVLDPVAWNRCALNNQSYEGNVIAPGDEALKGYTPRRDYTGMNNFPVAVYGAHNSPRIVAQRGVFTVFGKINKPIEEQHKNDAFSSDCLTKIVLRKSVLPKIRKSILEYGITESVVFPDLEGLAREIRRTFGFEV